MKRKTAKARKFPAPAEFHKINLQQLIVLYDRFWESIADLCRLTDYGEPLHFYIHNRLVAPLDKALFACQRAIKAAKPKDPREVEQRAAALYQHALRFDSTAKERHAILGEALLGGVPSEDVKSTVERIGKDHEILTIRRGRKIIWQSCRPAKSKQHAAKA